MPMKGEATRGAARVKISAKCRAGQHGSCVMQDCQHPAHAKVFSSWDQADIESVKTGRKMVYHQGVFTVGGPRA